MPQRPSLILASTSRYRRALLERLRVPFDVQAPQVDETVHPGETPMQACQRLALAKAHAVAAENPLALVIGSDQVAAVDGQTVSKPGSHDAARAQLRAMSGRTIQFHTAVAVARLDPAFESGEVTTVAVRFRPLSDTHIERYLHAEQPYDCAGSAKSEALGIALLDAITSEDPTALIGLPLIATCRLLRAAGLDPLDA